MKIIHVISSFSRGGRERQLATIAANTDMKKYPTKIVYFNKRKDSYIDEYKIIDTTIQINSLGRIARLIELSKILKKETPDIVYAWGNGEAVSVLVLSLFHGFVFINGSVRHGIRSRKFWHSFRTLVLHFSKNIVANSYAGLNINKLKKGKVLYNGIGDRFIGTYNTKKKSLERSKLLGIKNTKPVLISVANLVPYKDYLSILKSLKQIKEEGYSFTYLVLGDGPMHNEIVNYIQEYGMYDNVWLIGHVENVSDYLKIADIFIHSSKGEGCSNAILEAMASGLPIIATHTGGTPEIVSNENGRLFEYKDHKQLTSYLRDLITNGNKANQMGLKSIEIIKGKFTIDLMMKNYYSIINSIK